MEFLEYLPWICQLLRRSAVRIFINVLHVEGINLPVYVVDLGGLSVNSAAIRCAFNLLVVS